MNIKASGRSALIIATGFWLCVSAPLQAAEDADGGVATSKAESAAGAPVALNKFARKSRKHVSSHRKSVKVASTAKASETKASETKASETKASETKAWENKASESKASEKKKAVEADAVLKDDGSPSVLPPAIANANAQLAAADVPADDPSSVSTKASNMLRAMAARQGDAADPQASVPATNTDVVAADQLNDVDRALSENKNQDKPALAPTVAMAMAQAPAAVSNDDSTWGQTSLIGKIFIAFGALLTMASAARMFMA
jgi:hypothetical protein